MKISVISPSYNQVQFLPANLRSVAAQKDVEVEHVLIDPGSTDGSLELARTAPNVVLIEDPDRGQSHGITKGFQACTGDVMVWLNSDDFFPRDDTLKKVADGFAANPEADIIYGKVNFVDDNEKILREGFVNKRPETLLEPFQHQVGIVQPAVFMRRRVFEELGDPSVDYEYWTRTAEAQFNWVYIDEVLAHHRWWDGMKTANDPDDSLVESFPVCAKYFGYIHHGLYLTGRDATNGILVYPDPLSVIAASMEKGEDGLEILKDWQLKASNQLALYRKMRDKLKVAEDSHAAPASVRAVAPEILGQDLREDNPLFHALASQLFAKDPVAVRVLAELRCSGAAPSTEYGDIDITAAVTHAQNTESAPPRALPVGSTELLQEQVIQLQATAETYYHDAEQMRRSGADGNGVGNSYLQAQVDALQLEIEHIYNSNSYRITKPMRDFRRWFGARRTR